MPALIIDMKDFYIRTPEQVLRVFFSLYDSHEVRAQLLALFVQMEGKNKDYQEKLANLFDHLIALCDALEKLRDQTVGTCPVCGRA